jgi:hypothetical protein
MVIDAPNHFDKRPLCPILTNPMIAKITDKDKITAELKKPKGLREVNSMGMPPINDMSNHLVIWLTQIAVEYVTNVSAIHFFTSRPNWFSVLLIIFLRKIIRNGIVKML